MHVREQEYQTLDLRKNFFIHIQKKKMECCAKQLVLQQKFESGSI